MPTDTSSMASRPMTSTDVSSVPSAARQPLRATPFVTGGFWAERQAVNRSTSLHGAVQHLEQAGNLHNLRLAAGRASGPYRTPANEELPFLDTDVYKWLEAVGWEMARAPDPELERTADEIIELLAAAQEEDGYLDSYYQVEGRRDQRWTDLAHGHELYCAGHLIQAAIAHERARGDETLLEVARRFADHIDRQFGPSSHEGVGGHPEIEMALVELYRSTGERRYLELARYFVDTRGRGHAGNNAFGASYMQDHQPVREQTTVTGHAVRALYLAAGVTDVYLETGDGSLLAALETQWRSMTSSKMYLTGGVGSYHRDEAFGKPYELPPDRAYNETCAAIGSVMWSWRMLLATGEACYADLIERTLYNAFAPGMSLDGQRYFYINRLQSRIDIDVPPPSETPRDSIERQEWFGCACCPPNVMRLLATLEHYLATTSGAGVQIHQYATSSLAVPTTAGRIGLEVETMYPHAGDVTVRVVEAPDGEVDLSLRIPAWCHGATMTLNGRPLDLNVPTNDGYVAVARRWDSGDELKLHLPMTPRVVEPHPYVDSIRGCVAIERGPLVYCLEGLDLPEGVALADVRIHPDAPLVEQPAPNFLGGVVAVQASGEVQPPDDGWFEALHREVGFNSKPSRTPITLTAIPYYAWANRGATTMRVWVPTELDAGSGLPVA